MDLIQLKVQLDRAGIKYLVKNEHIQELLGAGRLGTGFNTISGPPSIWVRQEDLDSARQALTDIYEIFSDQLPEICPACETDIPKGKIDCPECGLFLG